MELTHNNYVMIKRISKVDIKQNNISTVILLIKFLVYQWDSRHLQGSRVIYIFVNIMKVVFYLISTHFLCVSIRRMRFNLIICDCTKNDRAYGWKTKTESTNWRRVYLYHENNRWGRILIRYSICRSYLFGT